MKISKWLFCGVAVLIMILIGGSIYETISSHFTIRTRDDTIAEYIADNQHLRDGLADAEDRVTSLETTIEDYKRGSEDLREQLRASQDSTAELADLYRILAGEYKRLGEAISSSNRAAGSIAEHSKLLGESIDRAWDILERYPIPIGSE